MVCMCRTEQAIPSASVDDFIGIIGRHSGAVLFTVIILLLGVISLVKKNQKQETKARDLQWQQQYAINAQQLKTGEVILATMEKLRENLNKDLNILEVKQDKLNEKVILLEVLQKTSENSQNIFHGAEANSLVTLNANMRSVIETFKDVAEKLSGTVKIEVTK